MRVLYIPPKIESVNDVVDLSESMRSVVRFARSYGGIVEVRKSLHSSVGKTCVVCRNPGFCEMHHVKPVWAMSIEYLMGYMDDRHPHSTAWDLRNLSNQELNNIFAELHSVENLNLLCKHCHKTQDKVANRLWKLRLAQAHRLVYTIQWADRHMRMYYKDNETCPTLNEYVDDYIKKQNVKLLNQLTTLTTLKTRIY